MSLKNFTRKKQVSEFDRAYEDFIRANDAPAHRRAIKRLLAEVELSDAFEDVLCEGGEQLKSFFLSFEDFARSEKDPKEREAVRELGRVVKKYWERDELAELADVFFGLAFRHVADFLKLKKRKDFEELTDHELYTKDILPAEIFLQFFFWKPLQKARLTTGSGICLS